MEVVFVHGLSASSRWWRGTALPYRTRAVDLPRRDPLEWLERELADVDDLVLVGHSFGGFVCASLALRRPLRALVLVAPTGVPLGYGFAGAGLPLLRTLLGTRRSFVPLVVADALRTGPRALLRAGALALRADLRARLPELRAPVLLVWGDRDPLVSPALADEWLRGLPNARLAVIEGAGHIPMVEAPAAFARELAAFLEEAEDEAT